uniref:C6 domain-containing protein n=1 Tax=Strongyloides papillosus TaxID=174720 RepID=A0A0N5C8P6_STREA
MSFNKGILLILFIFYDAYACISFLRRQSLENEFECCPHVDEYNLPRSDPPAYSTSYGWSNSSGLKYYEERICPMYAIYECNLNKNKDGTKVMIQFVKNNDTVIYEDVGEEHVAILVSCVNKEWVLNSQTFTSITCSQT